MIPQQAFTAFKTFTERNASRYLLLVLWVLAQLATYFHFGIKSPVDTAFYISDALSINQGVWSSDYTFWYSSYSCLLALIHRIGAPFEMIVLVQVLASGLAAVALYRLAVTWGGYPSAMIATLFYILWPEIHQWTMILYTDSLFTSMVIISVYSLRSSHSKAQYLGSFILIIITTFIRPPGMLFLMSILGSLWFHTQVKKLSGICRATVGIAVFSALLFFLNFVMTDYANSFIESYAKAEIIYPNISMLIDPPGNLQIPDPRHSPISRLILFVVYNPLYFIKLSLMKGLLYLGHIKPYFSLLHNLLIVLFLYPIYYFGIRELRLVRWNQLKLFTSLFIVSQILMVSLTTENWDGRFLIPLLPWLFIPAGQGIARVLSGPVH
ncbi:MAG: hypothetical protein RIC30_13605 [Marinoscillum sp.]|uniref:hypothetical protein n=1 Tax=Marinoscillum sp. TaxID=2024838 RepID=UPI0032F9E086